jgi:anti-sigma28 factor (negative regulator of flagellin synthesis)
MRIPTYQIHNTLNTYCKKLARSQTSGNYVKQADSETSHDASQMHVVHPDKCKRIFNKIETDIIDRITHCIIDQERSETNEPTDLISSAMQHHSSKDHFIFNAVDENNVKTTHRLPWVDSDFLDNGIRQPETPVDDASAASAESRQMPAGPYTQPLSRLLRQIMAPHCEPNSVEKAKDIEDIKEICESGHYIINTEKIAEKMIIFHTDSIHTDSI